jgi:hypothetical protein
MDNERPVTRWPVLFTPHDCSHESESITAVSHGLSSSDQTFVSAAHQNWQGVGEYGEPQLQRTARSTSPSPSKGSKVGSQSTAENGQSTPAESLNTTSLAIYNRIAALARTFAPSNATRGKAAEVLGVGQEELLSPRKSTAAFKDKSGTKTLGRLHRAVFRSGKNVEYAYSTTPRVSRADKSIALKPGPLIRASPFMKSVTRFPNVSYKVAKPAAPPTPTFDTGSGVAITKYPFKPLSEGHSKGRRSSGERGVMS